MESNYEQEERENEDEERELVHVENGSLVDEDEDDALGDVDEDGTDAAKDVNVKPPPAGRKRSLMDTIAKLSGSAKKKQISSPKR